MSNSVGHESSERPIRIDRQPLYMPSQQDTLFGWYHCAPNATQSDCVAVVCSPIGYEYIHSHRTVRHLADSLALSGTPTLRFDYSGVGDSTGTDLDPDRWNRWRANVRDVVDRARSLSGRSRICLLGLHLGATLAATVAGEVAVDLLVLWNVSVSGRRYIREMQAIASAAGDAPAASDGSIESAGFILSTETVASVRSVNLIECELKVRDRILILGRDDLAPDRSLPDLLSNRSQAFDYADVAGYSTMMAEPQFTVVPVPAIEKISGWVAANSARSNAVTAVGGVPQIAAFTIENGSTTSFSVEERCCRMGTESDLFGVLTRPVQPIAVLPVIVFFNAGCVHHVGPNRLYVQLARDLATRGFPSLRFDLGGIGDSISMREEPENHPYPAFAGDNARTALAYLLELRELRENFSFDRFILIGLCSGAHTAFHAAVELTSMPISEVVLINPLTYHWVGGMSLETTRRFSDMSHYKGSMRNPASWLKLLRGQADWGKIANVVKSYAGTRVNALRHSAGEIFFPASATPLSLNLHKLAEMRCKMNFFISDGDPGWDILTADAGRAGKSLLKAGKLSLTMIPDADHTFSRASSRQHLRERLAESLETQYAGPATSGSNP
ncbi:MAG: alpha/beta fold hydrolase [Betaproteobacteria bacterium]